MDIVMQYLSFFVIQSEGEDPEAAKTYRHYQTLHRESYESSELKEFLHGELERILKRKAERNPKTEQAPTKIGRFQVEPGYELTSNPNYNLFRRLRETSTREDFQTVSDDLIRTYLNTSAVRGGAFIVAAAKLPKYYDDPFVFVLKCDFEPKIARIADEKSLVSQVEMAISARSIKSIQYPYMPEPGMLEDWELKIHQASHARYFEDFLKYVTYEKSKPAIVTEQMLGMVQEYMDAKWQGSDSAERGADGTGTDWAGADRTGVDGAGAVGAGFGGGGAGGAGFDGGGAGGTGFDGTEAEKDGGAEANGTAAHEAADARGSAAADAPPWDEASGAAGDAALRAAAMSGPEAAGSEAAAAAGLPARPAAVAAHARRREEERLEIWAAGEKRELQERWSHEQVAEAAQRIAETQPDYEMNFKLDAVTVRAKMEEYGKSVHIARLNGRYVVLIEGDAFRFDKGISPVELLAPEPFGEVVARLAEEADRRTIEAREERQREREERLTREAAGATGAAGAAGAAEAANANGGAGVGGGGRTGQGADAGSSAQTAVGSSQASANRDDDRADRLPWE